MGVAVRRRSRGADGPVLRDAAAARCSRSTITSMTCRRWRTRRTPYLPRAVIGRTANHHASFDAGRGCPFQCSFCTIINVQGRKSRRRSPDDIERLIKEHWAEGVRRFFITDDNFARNKDWEADLRPHHPDPRARQDQDPADHPGRYAVPQAAEFHREGGAGGCHAGVHRAGEHQSGEPAGGEEAAEPHHRIPHHAAGVEARGVITYAGYILGFPADTPAIGEARHRDHPARTAGRYPGVLLPDAAARVGGSQGADPEGRLDGPRHEQIRPGACRRRPLANEPRGMGARSTAARGRRITRARTCGRSCAARRVRGWG